MAALLGGLPVFGLAVRVVHEPAERAADTRSYFGQGGVTRLDGGGRGRRFLVSGVFDGLVPADCVAAEAVLLSYADGVGRVFVDTQGRVWPNVIFEGAYYPDPRGPVATGTGYCLAYRCELTGLT